MNWRDALKSIGENTVENLATPLRVTSQVGPAWDSMKTIAAPVAGAAWDHVIKPVGDEFINSNHPKEWMGDLQYYVAKFGPDVVLDTMNKVGGDPIRAKDVLSAHEKGFNGRSGGRAVWELMQSGNPGPLRFAADVGIDPTTYLTFGGSSVGKSLTVKGAEVAAEGGLAKGVLGTAMKGTGRTLRVAELPDKATDYVTSEVIGRVAATRPGRWISELSPKEQVRKQLDQGYSWYMRMRTESKPADQLLGEMTKHDASISQAKSDLSAARKASGMANPQMMRNTTKPFQNEDLVLRATRFFAKDPSKPITPAQLGDRMLEYGPQAGQSIADAANRTLVEVYSDKMWFKSKGISWGADKKIKDVQKEIALIPDVNLREEAATRLNNWISQGFDPVHASLTDMFKHRFMQVLEQDAGTPTLSKEANDWLNGNILKSGLRDKTYMQALTIWEKEAEKDRKTILDLVGSNAWKRDTDVRMIERILSEHKGAMKIVNKWRETGRDILNDPINELAFGRLEASVYHDNGIIAAPKSGFFTDLAKVWKGQALLSPRYHGANVMSSWLNNVLVNGFDGFSTPKDFWDEIAHNVKNDPDTRDVFGSLDLQDFFENHGMITVNRNISRSGLSSMVSDSKNSSERLFRRIYLENVGTQFGRLIELNRRIGAGIDASSRAHLFKSKIEAALEPTIDGLRAEVRKAADKQKLGLPDGIELVPYRDASQLLGYYRGLGFSDGMARRLTRNYSEELNKAEKEGLAIVHKAHFSYYRTHLDEMISKVVPFHYYSSRAIRLYGDAMARNPVLLVNFARMAQELTSGYQESGLNARQKGWLYIMSGPAGFTMLMSPDAMFGFTRAMGLMGDNYKSDQTQLGGILTFMKSSGFGMYPWIDGLFNMAGTYGDSFEPDMLGIRHRALVGSVVNWLAGETGMGQAGMQAAPYAELNAILRGELSSRLSKIAPGWMSQTVMPKANDTGTIAEASMENLIESRVISNNPNLTYEELFAIMNNEDSPQYQEAWQEVVRSGVANQLMSFILPVGVKARDKAKDVRDAQVSVTYKYAKELGINAEDVTPQKDAEFATEYKLVTGMDWKPGAFVDARFKQELARATPEGRRFIIKDYQYNNLGTSSGRAAYATYKDIKYGNIDAPGMPKTTDPAQRENNAARWLSGQPGQVQADVANIISLQKSFRTVNADYGAYKEWQGRMFELQSMLGGDLSIYRERISAANPNAARYFAAKRAEIAGKYKEVEKRVVEMNRATTSVEAWFAINGQAQRATGQRSLGTNSNAAPGYEPSQDMLGPRGDQGGGQASAPLLTPSQKYR